MEASKVSWAAARPARKAADDGSGSDSSGSSGPADFLSSGAPPPAAAVGPPVADGFDLEGLLAELLSEEETKQLQAMQQDYSFEVQENQAEAPGSDADGEDEGASDSDGNGNDFQLVEEALSQADSASVASSGDTPAPDGDEQDPSSAERPAQRSLEQVREARMQALRLSRASGLRDEVAEAYRLDVQSSAKSGVFVYDGLLPGGQPTNRLIGRVVTCFGGGTLCGTCERHPKCKFLLTAKPALGLSLLHVEADVLSWLAAGTEVSASEHAELMVRCKRDYYLMRVRP